MFGGRRADENLLNDAWLGEVRWPNITWRLLAAGDSPSENLKPEKGALDILELEATGNKNETEKKKKKKKPTATFPSRRKGHSAIIRTSSTQKGALEMIIYGGRDNDGYLDDMWGLNLSTGTWEEIHVKERSPLPPPRDHHAAELGASGHMIIYGGRSGPTYEASQALGDLWAFDFGSKTWSEVLQYGLRPPPRFHFQSPDQERNSMRQQRGLRDCLFLGEKA